MIALRWNTSVRTGEKRSSPTRRKRRRVEGPREKVREVINFKPVKTARWVTRDWWSDARGESARGVGLVSGLSPARSDSDHQTRKSRHPESTASYFACSVRLWNRAANRRNDCRARCVRMKIILIQLLLLPLCSRVFIVDFRLTTARERLFWVTVRSIVQWCFLTCDVNLTPIQLSKLTCLLDSDLFLLLLIKETQLI